MDSKWNDSAPDLVKDLFLTRGIYHYFLIIICTPHVCINDGLVYMYVCVGWGGERNDK